MGTSSEGDGPDCPGMLPGVTFLLSWNHSGSCSYISKYLLGSNFEDRKAILMVWGNSINLPSMMEFCQDTITQFHPYFLNFSKKITVRTNIWNELDSLKRVLTCENVIPSATFRDRYHRIRHLHFRANLSDWVTGPRAHSQ